MFWRSAIFMICRMGEGDDNCDWTMDESGGAVTEDMVEIISEKSRGRPFSLLTSYFSLQAA
jgi:hypothetical protein